MAPDTPLVIWTIGHAQETDASENVLFVPTHEDAPRWISGLLPPIYKRVKAEEAAGADDVELLEGLSRCYGGRTLTRGSHLRKH